MLIYLLILVFAYTRLTNLMAFPPFLDETIYIRWLETIKATNNWLLPLKEFGWEPFSIWISTVINFFVKNSLLSLRLTAVIFGLLTCIILYLLLKKLAKPPAALFILLTYITSPIILLHDRLGLRGDSVVSFALVLALYGLYFRLIKKQPQKSYLISLAIIIGLLTKTTAATIPIIVLINFLIFKPKLKKPDFKALILTTTPFLFYFLTNTFNLVLNKFSIFINTNSFNFQTKNNLLQIIPWFYQYLSWPIVFLFIAGIVLSFYQNKNFFKFFIISFLVPLLFVLFTAKILFPRYLLLSYLSALVFAGFGLSHLYRYLPKLLRPLIIIFFLPSLFLSFNITKNIQAAKLPEIERWQYVTGWPSGFGLTDMVNYLKTDTPDILITENSDLIRSGLPYLWPETTIKIIPIIDNLDLPSINQDQTIYLALNVLEELPDKFEGELLKEFFRPENKSSIKLYKIFEIK